MQTSDIISDIIHREGGYVNDPNDQGGPTKFGITLDTLRSYRNDKTLTATDVQDLTEEEATAIYSKMYVNDPGFNRLVGGVQAFMVDFGVNSGPGAAIRQLQGLLPGCKIDGILGPATAATANLCDQASLLTNLIHTRLAFVEHLAAVNPADQKFLAGWTARIESFKNG